MINSKILSFILFSFILLFSGCKMNPKNEYIEGTSLTIGLYLPVNGSIYGLQALNYLSGKKISTGTNELPKIVSAHNITNSSFGVFHIQDNNRTEIR